MTSGPPPKEHVKDHIVSFSLPTHALMVACDQRPRPPHRRRYAGGSCRVRVGGPCAPHVRAPARGRPTETQRPPTRGGAGGGGSPATTHMRSSQTPQIYSRVWK